ncbi:MAG: peptidyl-alpha-hydroxyglycine alpha-amidating lyase family protein [Prosthecobacter sp.]|uniref:peptidyl-alpha-hydroxyglycine alpha-amidating lyase family protein n=1 Tax=Prosthecobacter sp. TaxID=1965333 RepID=UPI00261801DB|nr:peptidyl-alpha-hydroxyglycine alpha-amidating lyase family protein [Prosthecobacter sp.]MCF7788885.1 peptidyl-alpha-hydroxyglycine alpha-amidating lyase family protein [Prosthecobacter sp.]
MRFVLFFGLLVTASLAQSQHEVVPGWPQLPEGHVLGLCAGVGVDAQNRVFVFHRSGRVWSKPFPKAAIAAPTVSVFDGATGRLLSTWGANRFIMPHGLTVDHAGNLWLTDVGLHQVFKCSPAGEVLLTLGEAGVPGSDDKHFNLPTDVAVLTDGSFYVSDGYQNTRVMKFTAAGRFEFQWGTKGHGPGEFHLPHGLTVDAQGRIIVCDRENERLQVFDAKGVFQHEWKGPQLGKPYGIATGLDGHLFVIDGGSPSLQPQLRGKAVELDPSGQVLDTFGSHGKAAGQFQLGHDIAVGPDGAVYVAEGTGARVQKFVRRKAAE